jgi:hypothetical protein
MGSHHRITVVEWRQWCVYVCIVVCYETDLAGVVFREPLILLPFIFFFFNILYILEQIFFYYMQVVRERHKVERGDSASAASAPSTACGSTRGRRAGTCAALAAANGRFRTAHALSVLATVASAVGLAAHSCYLAGKLAL